MNSKAGNELPSRVFRNESTYRLLSGLEGHFGCGFQLKSGVRQDAVDVMVRHYSAVLVLRGSGTFIDQAGHGQRLGPGNLFQRLPSQRHTTLIDPGSDWAECWIAINATSTAAFGAMGLIDLNRPVIQPGIDRTLVHRLDLAVGELRRASEADLPRHFTSLVAILVDLFALDRQLSGSDPQAVMVDLACRRLADDPGGRLPLAAIASELALGYERFRKVFRERMGMSPGEYRIRRRIDRAREMLRSGNASIKEIAHDLGYNSPFTFSLQFKQLVGTSPRAFRRGH